ncbi:MAG: hypothetical protein KJ906_02275 [Nanoarchaeota archaeon]|nr:hypothetical protein [Nanoarchaeota archaeon]
MRIESSKVYLNRKDFLDYISFIQTSECRPDENNNRCNYVLGGATFENCQIYKEILSLCPELGNGVKMAKKSVEESGDPNQTDFSCPLNKFRWNRIKSYLEDAKFEIVIESPDSASGSMD